MKDSDNDNCTQANGSDSPAWGSGMEERCREAKSGNGIKRYRKITDRLYQCLVTDTACSHQVSFGNKNFCSWLLRNDAGRSEQNFPCGKEDQAE